MAKLIKKTYGDALYETALEKNTLESLSAEVAFARECFEENPDFMRLLLHPQIDREEKIACLKNVFEGRVSNDLLGLMVVTVEKERQKDLRTFSRISWIGPGKRRASEEQRCRLPWSSGMSRRQRLRRS